MYDRGERVGEQLQQQISLLLREVKDPGLKGLLTVTDLKLARDRKSAVVYYSVLGSAEQKKSTAEALERIVGFLRHQLRERLTLRSIPKLLFQFDPTPERAQRIEEVLRTIERERGPEGDSGA